MLRFNVLFPDDDLKELNDARATIRMFSIPGGNFQELFMQDYCKRVVREIDGSEIISPNIVESPWLGSIPPYQLSGSGSTLIVLYIQCKNNQHDFYFRSSHIGDKCVPLLFELASQYDVNMWLCHRLKITEEIFNKYPGIMYSIDQDRVMESYEDFEDTWRVLNYQLNKILQERNKEFTEDPEWIAHDKMIAERDLARVLGWDFKWEGTNDSK